VPALAGTIDAPVSLIEILFVARFGPCPLTLMVFEALIAGIVMAISRGKM
jgi:hypothetical protein